MEERREHDAGHLGDGIAVQGDGGDLCDGGMNIVQLEGGIFMKIENEHEVRETIAIICEWLRLQSDKERYEAGKAYHGNYESSTAGIARELCFKILDAAECEGCGGCRLCGS